MDRKAKLAHRLAAINMLKAGNKRARLAMRRKVTLRMPVIKAGAD